MDNWEDIMAFNRKLNDLEQGYMHSKKETISFKQSLIEIRKIIINKKQTFYLNYSNVVFQFKESDIKDILQIIDNVLGEEK